ncbi:deoxyribodipyrimidine photo-lyase [Polaribacter pacificus]|uniref:Deoxyribodipyrimidine photo-lyase n=1 Tax=Polaribacter pacificus TaxID=1775173 RepID=A0A917MFG3_9FLAO|nr:deoxyribodipyrimidine photo-lyase [Polaribacter pacificus]GGH02751.1 deoxyribodipyrimidine photo-lyase [Polaribacter pacificus]
MVFFWFRRDLRLQDNVALFHALIENAEVVPVFIFDDQILSELPKDDARIGFIYDTLKELDQQLKSLGSSLLIKKGSPSDVWAKLFEEYAFSALYYNIDYEPYATQRDAQIQKFLESKQVLVQAFKDQVIFDTNQVVKDDGLPYTVFTPYKNKWLKKLKPDKDLKQYDVDQKHGSFYQFYAAFPTLNSLGFTLSTIKVKPYNLEYLNVYDQIRDAPFDDKTTYLSPHLRFGLLSSRSMVKKALASNATFLIELIWREFFMQILYHFPKVVTQNFKQKYDAVPWRNNEQEFERWCTGNTGYPMVDAGMRQLNTTGYMHNRVRMITAGFLCKHLLIDWRWGEAYFAKKLLDYDLSANNGNWQWAAGTGCDAAPYFRVFNPTAQQQKFDKDARYIRRWVSEFDTLDYALPMVDHKIARERAINTYKTALQS